MATYTCFSKQPATEPLQVNLSGDTCQTSQGPPTGRFNPAACSFCGKICSSRKNLKVHLRTHTGEKPYRCTICRKSFGQHNTLVAHVNIHTGQRPFACQFCGKSFKQSAHRNTHEKNHFQVKSEQCPVCLRCFSTKGILKRHSHRHTGEKPHECTICSRGFARAEALRKHQLKEHGQVLDGAPANYNQQPFGDLCRESAVSAAVPATGNADHFSASTWSPGSNTLAPELYAWTATPFGTDVDRHTDSGYSSPILPHEPPGEAMTHCNPADVFLTLSCPSVGNGCDMIAYSSCESCSSQLDTVSRNVSGFLPTRFFPSDVPEFFSNDFPEPRYG